MIYGLGAYIAWGVFPLYFRALSEVSPFLIVCHRIFWSVLFLVLVISIRREWKSILVAVSSWRNLTFLSVGAILIALNWLIFIYAVSQRQVLQASLGYFINPLVSIALGMVFLHERLRKWQWLAVLLATVAVANLALRGHGFPWISVSLALTFGFYGLVRKKVDINSLHGLLIETVVLLPLALIMMAAPVFPNSSSRNLAILSLSGVITAVPLLMFGAAVRLLKLSTVGFLQYVGPTLQFLVALVAFRESLDHAKLVSFGLCWLAIGVYVADSILNRQPQLVADEPE